MAIDEDVAKMSEHYKGGQFEEMCKPEYSEAARKEFVEILVGDGDMKGLDDIRGYEAFNEIAINKFSELGMHHKLHYTINKLKLSENTVVKNSIIYNKAKNFGDLALAAQTLLLQYAYIREKGNVLQNLMDLCQMAPDPDKILEVCIEHDISLAQKGIYQRSLRNDDLPKQFELTNKIIGLLEEFDNQSQDPEDVKRNNLIRQKLVFEKQLPLCPEISEQRKQLYLTLCGICADLKNEKGVREMLGNYEDLCHQIYEATKQQVRAELSQKLGKPVDPPEKEGILMPSDSDFGRIAQQETGRMNLILEEADLKRTSKKEIRIGDIVTE